MLYVNPTITGQGIPRPLKKFLRPPLPLILKPSNNSKAKNREQSHHTMAIKKWKGKDENHCQNMKKSCHWQQNSKIPTCTCHACQNQLGEHTWNLLLVSLFMSKFSCSNLSLLDIFFPFLSLSFLFLFFLPLLAWSLSHLGALLFSKTNSKNVSTKGWQKLPTDPQKNFYQWGFYFHNFPPHM